MAVREVIQIGDPRLKLPSKKIEDINAKSVQELIDDLRDTMRAAGIVGIAAPQIGVNLQVFLTEPRATETRSAEQSDNLRVYMNPEIVAESTEKIEIYEGCGSVLKGQLFGPVSRPSWIEMSALDDEGHKFNFKADGILGRVMQHEYDHLQGVEFTEKISDYAKLMSRYHYIKQIKNQPWHIKNCEIAMMQFEQ